MRISSKPRQQLPGLITASHFNVAHQITLGNARGSFQRGAQWLGNAQCQAPSHKNCHQQHQYACGGNDADSLLITAIGLLGGLVGALPLHADKGRQLGQCLGQQRINLAGNHRSGLLSIELACKVHGFFKVRIGLGVNVVQAGEQFALFGLQPGRFQLAFGGDVQPALLFGFDLVFLDLFHLGLQAHIAHSHRALQ